MACSVVGALISNPTGAGAYRFGWSVDLIWAIRVRLDGWDLCTPFYCGEIAKEPLHFPETKPPSILSQNKLQPSPENYVFTTGKHLIPVGLKPTGISPKPTGISNSRRFRAYSRRFQADGRPLSGIRLSPSAADGNN
jgi:hypothetical protein